MIRLANARPCFHGGAIYTHIGDDFQHLDVSAQVIDADVLDAWFSPSPRALAVLEEHLVWSIRSSPPVVPSGVERQLSEVNNISSEHIVCGAGSSSLIFLALRDVLNTQSRVLLLDPTYGEYAHVLSEVIGCRYDSFSLLPEEDYKVDLVKLVTQLKTRKYDAIIIVNPNNPSGQIIPRCELEEASALIPRHTLIWIDEAYIDYAGREQSIGDFAATQPNMIVCKSLSKVMALSGLRAAYLVTNARLANRLKLITPPWSLSLPAQLLLIEALKDLEYYRERYAETSELRGILSRNLFELGLTPRASVANFLLVDYPAKLPSASELLEQCAEKGLLLRNVQSMGQMTSSHSFRIAVKSESTNLRAVDILKASISEC